MGSEEIEINSLMLSSKSLVQSVRLKLIMIGSNNLNDQVLLKRLIKAKDCKSDQ